MFENVFVWLLKMTTSNEIFDLNKWYMFISKLFIFPDSCQFIGCIGSKVSDNKWRWVALAATLLQSCRLLLGWGTEAGSGSLAALCLREHGTSTRPRAWVCSTIPSFRGLCRRLLARPLPLPTSILWCKSPQAPWQGWWSIRKAWPLTPRSPQRPLEVCAGQSSRGLWVLPLNTLPLMAKRL